MSVQVVKRVGFIRSGIGDGVNDGLTDGESDGVKYELLMLPAIVIK
jgi:hypothetical protein